MRLWVGFHVHRSVFTSTDRSSRQRVGLHVRGLVFTSAGRSTHPRVGLHVQGSVGSLSTSLGRSLCNFLRQKQSQVNCSVMQLIYLSLALSLSRSLALSLALSLYLSLRQIYSGWRTVDDARWLTDVDDAQWMMGRGSLMYSHVLY